MVEVTGDFQVHLTVAEQQAGDLAAFAIFHELAYSHIVLDRGASPTQPMLNLNGTGTLRDQLELAWRWQSRLQRSGLDVRRIKVEAAPWNAGVPDNDRDAREEDPRRYFEHHVKLLLPDADQARLDALTALAQRYGARLSRNARRLRPGGGEERFVTQRCRRVPRKVAQQQVDELVAALRAAGHEPVRVEQEYVVFDSAVALDAGWLERARNGNDFHEDQARRAPAGSHGYPSTYRPLPDEPGLRQRAAFDPAMKHFRNGYRAGEPQFDDEWSGRRWRIARHVAMAHVLDLITSSPWGRHLVLRGSVPLRTWLGKDAREPGDLDFVVTPHTLGPDDPTAARMFDDIIAAVRDNPGNGVRADGVAVEDIWTYERAPGRRLVFPFRTGSLPPGNVQVDVVFHEQLPVPPVPTRIQPLPRPVLTATPELSLAWKLLWLATDTYPQGKDLYDAALLARYTPVRLELVREVLRPELGDEADAFGPASVLQWSVDWENFHDEYPDIRGDGATWQHRLALALYESSGLFPHTGERPVGSGDG